MEARQKAMKPFLELVENYHSSNKLSGTVRDSKSVSEENKASASSTEIFSDKVMTKIWVRMLAIYGHKWASHLGSAVDADGRLSEAARTWQQGLVGVSLENLKTAFDALVLETHEWPPSLPEFRRLCLSGISGDAPLLDEVVSILVMDKSHQGSLAERYQHPLVLAIAQTDGVDMFFLRTAKTAEARAYVRPVYEKLLGTGWAGWPEHAFENTKAIATDKPVPDKALGRKSFSDVRASLGMNRVADKLQGKSA